MTQPLIEQETELLACFESQQAAFMQDTYPSYESRRSQLQTLKQAIQDNQLRIAEAIEQDFGHRDVNETLMADLLSSVLDINHTLKSLKSWMKPEKRKTELLFKGNSAEVQQQPKGVVGIIVPWNLPVYLAIAPLAAALAAGNRAIIKMSESTPQTARVLADVLRSVFSPTQVAVVGGEIAMAQYFASLPWNHLIYTGSTQVGKLVMAAAAKNLTPVTLELGGKSPAIVSAHADIDFAARKIAHGKTTNAGQVCISPDYVLLHQDHTETFIAALEKHYAGLIADESCRTSIINERHFQRLQSMIQDAEDKGANVQMLGGQSLEAAERYWPLTTVSQTTPEMRVLQEEIFGPILPIVTYSTLDEAVAHINQRPRPLALYFFGDNELEQDQVLKQTHSGGVTINDWGWHALNHDLPFGGTGDSGMGKYHGREGFLELSNARPVLRMKKAFPIQLFHPPYGKLHQQVFKMFLGKSE